LAEALFREFLSSAEAKSGDFEAGTYFSNRQNSLYDCGLIMLLSRDEFDPLAPQREAAMFYGLFLRGHSAEALRRDIDVPRPILNKWLQPRRYENDFRDSLRRMYLYRKKVLAIFDELVWKEKHRIRVQ
jgi:hypothetical protein